MHVELEVYEPPSVVGSVLVSPLGGASTLWVRCFGGFELRVGGAPVDCSVVKPRVRSLLRLLAAHAGRSVHRERIIEWLWPELDLRSGIRSLQVAVSSLRRLLEPGAGRGESSLVTRDGETYRLALADEGQADVAVFETAIAAGRAAWAAGRPVDAGQAYEVALDVYAGDLLPEEGPTEWAVSLRDQYRLDAAQAANGLAELTLARGEAARAAGVCRRGLAIDPYGDGLWRLFIEASESAGNPATAARAKVGYRAMLTDLGLGDDQSWAHVVSGSAGARTGDRPR